jgi:hypothetical protein
MRGYWTGAPANMRTVPTGAVDFNPTQNRRSWRGAPLRGSSSDGDAALPVPQSGLEQGCAVRETKSV